MKHAKQLRNRVIINRHTLANQLNYLTGPLTRSLTGTLTTESDVKGIRLLLPLRLNMMFRILAQEERDDKEGRQS